MSKKTKVIESNIQPNPKEAEIWAKVNEDGSREIKQYNRSTGKFECCGGSSSGSGEVSTVEYLMYRDSDLDESAGLVIATAIAMSSKCRIEDPDNGISVVPTHYQVSQGGSGLMHCTHFEIDFNATVIFGGQVMTILDYFKMLDDYTGSNYVEILSSVKRITREQFYSL